MPEPTLLMETTDRVRVFTLNRPDVMNAFDDDMREALVEGLEAAAEDDDVRCVLITGAGRAFCAGGDIASMAKLQERNDTQVLEGRVALAARGVRALRAMRKPAVAAVNGPAAGAGINLALACDIRLGCENSLFSESFVRIALVPDWGGFYFLPRIVGPAKALELMSTAERVRAEDALRLGLLNRLLPEEGFFEAALNFARTLADGPPRALASIKEGVYLGASSDLETALRFEADVQRELFLESDAREGMRAFLEKRKPSFGG
ncbi:MAG: 2-(1,2-epoxy-1,2-dihydrophenyl)acetyl-CoA isomerase [Myxococcales bacterium]|nr:2-(1,2-epoxy-1,2-dihydrophenyl)acetyl-CoA isomerase [Myxococcales bacterium]